MHIYAHLTRGGRGAAEAHACTHAYQAPARAARAHERQGQGRDDQAAAHVAGGRRRRTGGAAGAQAGGAGAVRGAEAQPELHGRRAGAARAARRLTPSQHAPAGACSDPSSTLRATRDLPLTADHSPLTTCHQVCSDPSSIVGGGGLSTREGAAALEKMCVALRRYLLPATYYLLPTTCCLLPAAYCVPLTTSYLLPGASRCGRSGTRSPRRWRATPTGRVSSRMRATA